MKKWRRRNWLTPRRSQSSHALERRRRLGRVAFEQRDVMAVLGEQHRARQSRHSPAGDHDLQPCAPRFDAGSVRGPLRRPQTTSATASGSALSGRCARPSGMIEPRHPARTSPGPEERPMHVPLTIGDFLERAALVHGADRVAVVDEPGVAGSLGAITYAEMHDRARGMALAFRRHGCGPRGAGRHREPELGPLPHLVLRRERVRPRARPRELPPQRRGGRRTSSSTRAPRCCSSTPRSRSHWRACRPRCGCCSTATRTPSCSPPRRPVPTRRAGRGTKPPRARSTTPRGRRPARRGCS